MPDQPSFVVNDRRKFTAEGELRPDAPRSTEKADDAPASTSPGASVAQAPGAGPQLVSEPRSGSEGYAPNLEGLADMPEADAVGPLLPEEQEAVSTGNDFLFDGSLPPGPTPEQASEAARAYAATVDRLDTAMRAANPGGERTPPMSFERLVQSLYTQALLLLGGGAEPGETPRVDILGARQTIDMLAVLDEKTRGNRSSDEEKLLESALFDLHMGFLEITQALARQAAQRAPAAGASGGFPATPGGGPRIVR